jgi:predicted P-loop ATPase
MPATLDVSLDKEHFKEWKSSAVSDSIINANVQTIFDPREINKILGRNASRKWGLTSDLVPAWYASGVDPLTDETTLQGVQVKPDKPPIGQNGKPQKYIGASGMETAPLFLRTEKEGLWKSVIDDLSQWVFICEGAKKAGSLLSIDIPAISVPGVTTCRKLGRLHQNLALFSKPGRNIVLAYDNDLMFKKGVQDGLEGLGRELRAYGNAKVWVLLLPEGEAKGVDDFLALHGEEAFRELLKSPETLPTFEEWLERKKEAEVEEEDNLPKSKFGRKFHCIQQSWAKDLQYNTLKQVIELKGQVLDADELQVTLFEHFDLDIGKQDAYTIVRTLAKRQSYSPVVDYLNECEAKFPGIDYSFLDGLAKQLFGTDDPLHATYFKNFLVASVARARVPGVKMDCALLLTGKQAGKKSTFWETLYGSDFFSDDFGDGSDKDEKMKMHRFWCLEWSEFETVYRKKDIAQLKAFMARKRDTYRAPYDIQNNDHLRRFVFCGTSNESEILNDPTGSRRFWIIPLKNKIPLELVAQLRDRIWAAANALFNTGYQFFLSDEEEIQRENLSKDYQVVDPWYESISRFASNRDYVTVDEIYHELSIEPARRDISNQRRITAVLKLLGLKDTRIPVGGVQTRVWTNDNYNNGIKNNLKSDNSAVCAVLPENQEAETHTQLVLDAKSVENDFQNDTHQINKTVEEKIEIPLSSYSRKDSSDFKTVKTAENENFSNNFTVESTHSSNTEVVQPLKKECFPPETNAALLREALAARDWGQIQELGDYWGEEFGHDYKSKVWDCLTKEEKQAIVNLKPGNRTVNKIKGIPLLKKDNIVCAFDKMIKIESIKGSRVRGLFAGEVELTEVDISDISACDKSELFNVSHKDRVKPITGKDKGKILTVSTLDGNNIWCKTEAKGTTPKMFYSHQLEKI